MITTDLRIAQIWALCALKDQSALERVTYGPDDNAIAFATIATDMGLDAFSAFTARRPD